MSSLLLTATLVAVWSCDWRQTPPFPEPDRLVVLHESDAGGSSLGVSIDSYLAWKKGSTPGLQSVSAHEVTEMELKGGAPRDVRAVRCTFDLFETLGVQPILGRSFAEGDRDRDVAVLSYELWRDRFAGKPDVIGTAISLDGKDHTVLGVLPEGNPYPQSTDVWTAVPYPAKMGGHSLMVTARLAPGVTLEQAEAVLKEVDLPCGHGAGVTAFQDVLSGDGSGPPPPAAAAKGPETGGR